MLKDENLEVVPEERKDGALKYRVLSDGSIEELDELTKEQMKTRQSDPCDPDFRRLQYTRYATIFCLVS